MLQDKSPPPPIPRGMDEWDCVADNENGPFYSDRRSRLEKKRAVDLGTGSYFWPWVEAQPTGAVHICALIKHLEPASENGCSDGRERGRLGRLQSTTLKLNRLWDQGLFNIERYVPQYNVCRLVADVTLM